MKKESYQFEFEVFESINELSEADQQLLHEARKVTQNAYAPYSHFNVGAVARLKTGQTISGTNQENASYPVGICAERVLLAAASVMHNNVPIDSMAITYHNLQGESSKPVSPCGMCRQSLVEYEERTGGPIRLILSGMEGNVYIIKKAGQLLPFSFNGTDMK